MPTTSPTLVKALDLKDAIHVGHSTGGGEVARYIGRHGTKRVAKAVLVDAVTPGMLKTAKNPDGMPIEVFDRSAPAFKADRSQFWKDLSAAVLRCQPPGRQGLAGRSDAFWLHGHAGGFVATLRLHQGLLRDRLHRGRQEVRHPDAMIHGDDDQIVPINVGGLRSAKMIKDATLKVYKGAPHGLMSTHKEQFNTDLMQFAEQETALSGNWRTSLRFSHQRGPRPSA